MPAIERRRRGASGPPHITPPSRRIARPRLRGSGRVSARASAALTSASPDAGPAKKLYKIVADAGELRDDHDEREDGARRAESSPARRNWPHTDDAIRKWNRHSGARWRGDTLGVEPLIFRRKCESWGARQAPPHRPVHAPDSADVLNYELPSDDPTDVVRRSGRPMIPRSRRTERSKNKSETRERWRFPDMLRRPPPPTASQERRSGQDGKRRVTLGRRAFLALSNSSAAGPRRAAGAAPRAMSLDAFIGLSSRMKRTATRSPRRRTRC